ncbi:MAG: hypothetical protein PHS14_18060 [Elusimicrobia bacterium]|nr:hypothetical protein [Elusimicrobiota bacterium]
MGSDRCLPDVLGKMIALIPRDNQQWAGLIHGLASVRESASFAPPEAQQMWWRRGAEEMGAYLGQGELTVPWQVQIANIWLDRESAPVDSTHNDLETEPIHNWFELSYAQYLTVPRSVLQSMPAEWQRRFVECLEELDSTFDWRPEGGRYWVKLKDDRGRYVTDELADYERGRRRVSNRDNRIGRAR